VASAYSGGWAAWPCVSFIRSASKERHSIPCARGPKIAPCRQSRANLSGKCGEHKMASVENPSRERILGRIRTALQTTAPRHNGPVGQIFAPVTDPLDRFQKECVTNITECTVTSNSEESAAAIAKVLASLPAGEAFVQDAPELRALVKGFQDGRPLRWSSEG